MLEVACFNAPSAVSAALAGADRIELCVSYALGGTTPPRSTLDSIRAGLRESNPAIPIHVMIRPRGGDFDYSAAELGQMQSDVEMFRESGAADGFVFGVLTAGSKVDEARNRALVDAARPLPCTFHRAIDQVDDLEAAVETVIDCGFKSILTSGGARSAVEGRDRVAELQKRYGSQISIVIGGGIRSTNVLELKNETGVEWVHSAAITGSSEEVDGEEVSTMVELLQNA